jgi:hypothetical protein
MGECPQGITVKNVFFMPMFAAKWHEVTKKLPCTGTPSIFIKVVIIALTGRGLLNMTT